MRFSRGVLALLSTVIALAAAELVCRLWFPPPRHFANQALVFDPVLGFRGEPNARIDGFDAQGSFQVRLDEQGLRRRERGGAASAPAREVALVGDSFVVAQGVRDANTLAGQLETQLAGRGLPVRVHDLAVVDYGSAQELMLWREQGAHLGAAITVLALYPANDLANNTLALAGRTLVSPGDYLRPYLVPSPRGGFERRFAHPWRAGLRRASRAFALLESRALAFGVARDIRWLAPWPAPASARSRLRAGLAPREELELYREPAPGSAWAEAWTTTSLLMRAFSDEVRAAGGRFVVLVIPALLEVQEEGTSIQLDLLARRYAGRGVRELLDWNLPERRLAEIFAAEGIEAVSLLDSFRAAAGRGSALYVSDGHFAPQGHALAAAQLAEALAGSPHTPAPLQSAGPAPLLPAPDEAAAVLDFHSGAHEAYLVRGGWLSHSASGAAAGWQPAARASLVLPARAGDLVLRGRVPTDAPLPMEVRLRLGAARAQLEIAEPGSFSLRLPTPLAADESRWVEVQLGFEARARIGRQPARVYVESVGFER